jgi:hypothetical protein
MLTSVLIMYIFAKAPFGLMEYNEMERNGMDYNNVSLFGFEK